MSKVLVVWEDRFHAKLDLCLRRALRHLGLPPPALFFDKVLGYGGFEPYVKESWPEAAHRGLVHAQNRSGGPIEHLLCVADADRAHECCDVENPTTHAIAKLSARVPDLAALAQLVSGLPA